MINVIKGICFEGSTIVLLARLVLPSGEYPVQSDIDAVEVHAIRLDTEAETYGDEPEVAEVFYSTLQIDRRWKTDSSGFNLCIIIPPDATPEGGIKYHFEVIVTAVGGHVVEAVWEVNAEEIYSR